MSPPCGPAPGPISITWSAAAITSMSCSTTTIVLPAPRNPETRPSSRLVSRAWRPAVGSSSTYVTPVRPDLSAAASRTRCASPPESVDAARSRPRYPSPASRRPARRPMMSSLRSAPIDPSRSSTADRPPGALPKNSRLSSTVFDSSSWMFTPPTRTASASGIRRPPPQAPHGTETMRGSRASPRRSACVRTYSRRTNSSRPGHADVKRCAPARVPRRYRHSTSNTRSPAPRRAISRARSLSASQGAETSTPSADAAASSVAMCCPWGSP